MAEPPVTQLLLEWRAGSPEAFDKLTDVVYAELRRLAHQQMRHEKKGHLLQTTALVNEAYMRLVEIRVDWRDRVHFFKVAARQMRRVLVDSARRRQALKRGGDQDLPIESLKLATEPSFDVIALDHALSRLAQKDPRKTQIVELRFFGGLSVNEISDMVEVSRATVERDLQMAKAWLRRAMSRSAHDSVN